VPQLAGCGDGVVVAVETAKTDHCLSSAALRQDGHAGARLPVTSVSNRW